MNLVNTQYEPLVVEHNQLNSRSADTPHRWSERGWHDRLKNFCLNIEHFSPEDRLYWLTALRDWLEDWPPLSTKTLDTVIEFASLLCDWRLVAEISIHYFKLHSTAHLKNNSAAICHFAYAYWRRGYKAEAKELLKKHLLCEPENLSLFSLYNYLLDIEQQANVDIYQQKSLSEQLFLESLEHHHVNEFYWQYWDPSIALLCCLPSFRNVDDWHNWLSQEKTLDDQLTFAVNHHYFGFIGVVSLVLHDDVGFFYYWLGKDFQKQGYGGEAVKLLLNLGMNYFGLSCCYAKVFEYNISSQKAMKKLGFTRLPLNAKNPHENEQLYYWGEDKSDKEKCVELQHLFKKMRSSTDVDLPLSWLILND